MVFATTQTLNDTFGSSSMLRTQLQNNIQARATAATKMIADQTDAKVSMMGLERSKWESVRSSIGEAKPQFESAVSALQSAKSMISGLRGMINRANITTDPNMYKGYASTFQSYVKSVVSSLTSAQGRTALLAEGDAKNNSVSYKISTTGAEQIEFGRDLAPKYSLVSGTDVWKVNRSQNILQLYRGDKEQNMAANLTNGVRLDAINPDGSVNFTIGPDTATPTSYTNATMTSSGLPLKDVWYYEGLATQDGRNRALKDLEQFAATLDTQIARFQGMADVADFYDIRAKAAMDELDAKGMSIQEDAQKQAKEMQQTLQQQANVLLQALDSSAVTQLSYANLLKSASSGTKGGKLFDAIYKVTA